MATGTFGFLPLLLPAAALSADLGESATPPTQGVVAAWAGFGGAGPVAIGTPDPLGMPDLSGVQAPLFDGLLFGKIHLIPQEIAFGFVLSVQEYEIEVWNTLAHAAVLVDVDYGQAGGLSFPDLPALPNHWPVTRASVYTLRVTTDGVPQIDDRIVFEFDQALPELAITGSRIVTFPISPNWRETVEEGFDFLTDVLVSYAGNEQRIQLREIPIRSLTFAAMTERPKDTALLYAVLYDWQARVYGVPVWTDVGPLVADVALGATTIFVDTTDRGYEAGGLAVIWKSPQVWEAFQVDTVAADRITVRSPAQSAWAAAGGVLVLPMRTARLQDVISLSRLSQEAAVAELEFEVDNV